MWIFFIYLFVCVCECVRLWIFFLFKNNSFMPMAICIVFVYYSGHILSNQFLSFLFLLLLMLSVYIPSFQNHQFVQIKGILRHVTVKKYIFLWMFTLPCSLAFLLLLQLHLFLKAIHPNSSRTKICEICFFIGKFSSTNPIIMKTFYFDSIWYCIVYWHLALLFLYTLLLRILLGRRLKLEKRNLNSLSTLN